MKFAWILIALSSSLFANAVTAIKSIDLINNVKVIKIVNITQKELCLGTKADNIDLLIDLAQKENRIKFSKEIAYKQIFQMMPDGDKILLNCLKHASCNLESYIEVLGKSALHKKIVTTNPSLNLPQVNQIVGSINENLMNRYFQSTGWTKIEGEIGRNGIDGLFIKRNKNSQIIDVLVCESKYNKSGLQHTNNGLQMTNQWTLKKIDNLQKYYSNNQDYKSISSFVKNGSYRSMLWNLKVNNDDKLTISLKKLHDKEGKIVKNELEGSNKMKVNFKGNQVIDINNPKNNFHTEIISWYKQELHDF
jgi:hypothetical protein